MVAKPIWCKCKKHAWTRRQLYSAWERELPTMCPAPDCQREISLETIEQLLIQEGLLSNQGDTPSSQDSPGR